MIKQETIESSSEDDIFHVEGKTKNLIKIEILVENVPINFIIESDAGINVIDIWSCEKSLGKTKKKLICSYMHKEK